ncbi:hypothetical protein [Streptomyces sp. NPDC048560]|uniref:hypothetical protein n=1 Tax=Streptomyces sp. NPDC048560 TaxID=3155488 RepID=UPI003434D50D
MRAGRCSQNELWAVEVELRRAGGFERGLAGRLSRAHGGNERTRARAVTDARTAHDAENTKDEREPRPPGR